MTVAITGTTITGSVILGGDPPSAPFGVYASSATASSVNVSFAAPVNAGSDTIISYTAISSPGNISTTITQSVSGTITVTGLSSATTYTFTVYATNKFGNGIISNTSNAITTTPIIGQVYGGGYFAGQISATQNSIATHNLILAPKAYGWVGGNLQGSVVVPGIDGKAYGPFTGATSEYDGWINSFYLASQGSGYAGDWSRNLYINGYSDWYLPSVKELEILFYNFRPTPATSGMYNATVSGANSYSVPARGNYTLTLPGQTPLTAFQRGGSEALDDDYYWSSTYSTSLADPIRIFFDTNQGNSSGLQSVRYHNSGSAVRAIRRVAI